MAFKTIRLCEFLHSLHVPILRDFQLVYIDFRPPNFMKWVTACLLKSPHLKSAYRNKTQYKMLQFLNQRRQGEILHRQEGAGKKSRERGGEPCFAPKHTNFAPKRPSKQKNPTGHHSLATNFPVDRVRGSPLDLPEIP